VRANAGYPDLSLRKKLVAHLLLARAQSGHLLNLDGDWSLWEETLRGSAGAEARDYLRTKGEGSSKVHLSAHIGEVLRAFESKAPPDTEDAAKARRLFKIERDRLRKDAGYIDCETCAGTRPPCDGGNDAANMTNKPLCWKRVDRMVDCAVNIAQSAYSRLFPASSEEIPVQIAVSVLTAGNAGLGGSVTFPVDDSAHKRSADVTLYLPETIGRDEYLRSLYALFHEVFVHSVQALEVPGTRPVFDELCQFTEGFVDRAAAIVLCDALASRPPPRFESTYLRARFASETRRGNYKRTEAYNGDDSEARRVAERRLEGHQLFEQIQGLVGDRHVAVNVAMYLNLRLSTQDARTEIHDRLTWLANPAFSRRREKARRSLEQFAADGEWSSLANSLKFHASPDP
jgi:hypothetical protein